MFIAMIVIISFFHSPKTDNFVHLKSKIVVFRMCVRLNVSIQIFYNQSLIFLEAQTL